MPRFGEQLLYIAGRPVAATSGTLFESINPANGEVLARVHSAGRDDVEQAVTSARQGQQVWAAMGPFERARILRRAVDILRERNDELALLETLDTGKPLSETRSVDIVTGADVLEYYAGLIPAIEGEEIPLRDTAFAYTRPGGNRFNDDARGAWYCAFDAETALGEVAFHLTRELAAVDRFENVTDYAELVADFVGSFHDLRGAEFSKDPVLDPDTAAAYPAGQALAWHLRKQEAAIGLVYPSVRHAGGTCLAAFYPDLVQNLRQGGIWRLEWQGLPVPVITGL